MKLSQNRFGRPSLAAMVATRQGSLLLALLCAILAAMILVVALSRYRANVTKPVPQATVLVATAEIPKGMSGATIAARGLYRAMPIAASQLTPAAISNAAQLTTVTAQANILPGQQLTTTEFASLSGVDETLPRTQRAVEVSIGESPGATDILSPGSYVDIYATGSSSGSGSSGAPTGATLLASDVRVIKPGSPVPVTIGTKTITGSSMVLALNESDVPRVIANSGGLYLTLRPTKADPTPTGTVNAFAGKPTTTGATP